MAKVQLNTCVDYVTENVFKTVISCVYALYCLIGFL